MVEFLILLFAFWMHLGNNSFSFQHRELFLLYRRGDDVRTSVDTGFVYYLRSDFARGFGSAQATHAKVTPVASLLVFAFFLLSPGSDRV